MPTAYTIAGDLEDLLGGLALPGLTVEVEHNVDGPIIDTAGKKIRLNKRQPISVTDALTFVTPDLVGSDSTDLNIEPGTLQYRVIIKYPDAASATKRDTWSSGWFFLIEDSNLGDPELVTTVTPIVANTAAALIAEMIELRDQAAAPTAGQMATVDADSGSTFRQQQDARLSATLVPQTEFGGLIPPPMTTVTNGLRGTTPRSIDMIGSTLYGEHDNDIYTSTDEGETWTLLDASFPGVTLRRLIRATDGQVVAVAANGVWRSTGWGTGSLAWTLKITPTGTCTIPPFCADGQGNKFIVTEYSSDNRADSRYGHISLDGGVTWTVAYDSVAKHGTTLANGSHVHGCAYDPYSDRFYLSEGHDDGGTTGAIAGIYCSTDNGATWSRAAGMAQDPSPTAIVAVPDGLVCGADNVSNGIYGVRRRSNPANEALRAVWRWRTGRAGLVGFARRGYVQPGTSMVYFTFTTAFADVAPIIAAGTVESGGLVWTWPTLPVTNSDALDAPVLPSAKKLLTAATINGSSYLVKGTIGKPAADSADRADSGNILGGSNVSGDSMSAGKRSTTGSAIRSVAVGPEADASNTQDNVAVGYDATVGGSSATVVGSLAIAGALSAVVGKSATTGANTEGAVLGANASTTGSIAVAVGRSATAGSVGVAVGGSANGGAGGVAIGYQAVVTTGHGFAVALGRASVTTASNQVQIMDRHVELKELAADPAAPAANAARWFVKDNGAGKTQLCIRFNTGATQVIATEP